MSAQATQAAEIIDAERVGEEAPIRLPDNVVVEAAPPAFRVTRDTVLAEGELPPRADEHACFTAKDFTVPDWVKKRIAERGARNTRVNRDTTLARFEKWCEQEGRIAQPTTTTANVAAYFAYLLERRGSPAPRTSRTARTPCSPTAPGSSPDTRRASARTAPWSVR
ncbi:MULTISPECIES: hypothetical protein [Streptomyces]|uniref:Core-binding (CB) domain-containing protein n=2 Tax=Streptomyces TaxID=1883 RepID=A0ABV9JAR6_9ACTN